MSKSKRSSAIRGLTPAKAFSPFYDTARRFIGLSPATVDQYLKANGQASIAGHIVTLTAPGLPDHTGSVGLIHTGKAARWVNKFNQKSEQTGEDER